MKNLLLLVSFSFCFMSQVFAQVTPPPPPPPPSEAAFKFVEDMPHFPGCEEMTDKKERKKCSDEKMTTFIAENVKYPKAALEKGVEGTTVIRFIVGKDGSIIEPTIIRDIGEGCGQAALDAVELMNEMPVKWSPGKQRGKKVRVSFNVPVKFKLPEEAVEKTKINDEEIAPEKIEEKNDAPESAEKDNDKPFKVVDEMPRFPGCEDISDLDDRKKCSTSKMLKFIYENQKYPEEAKKAKVEGTTIIKFIVGEDGTIMDPTITKDIGSNCGAEALRIVKLMNEMPEKWIPGKQKGNNVDVTFNVFIKFRLD